MTSYTLPLLEAETQLRKLVERTQNTHQPVILTGEETNEPVAILLDPGVFELFQKRERQFFSMHLQELNRQLKQLEQAVVSQQDAQPAIEAFQRAANNLWNICPKAQRGICVTFVMASRRLAPDPMLAEQIDVLRAGVDLLREDLPSTTAIMNYHQRLFDCGLPPTLMGDNRLSKMYEDAL